MTTLQIYRPLSLGDRDQSRHQEPRLGDRLEAFFAGAADRGNVALRLMLLGSLVTAVFAMLGYAVFGAGNQHQFFRDIGPVTALSTLETFSIGYIGLLIACRAQPGGGLGRWLNFWFLAGAGFLLLTFDSPLDLHGRAGHLIAGQTTVAEDIGFHGTGDAILALYMLAGLAVAAVYWREVFGDRLVLAHLIVGGLFIVASIGIDGFAPHSSWAWVVEELVELFGLAAIAGAFALRLNAARRQEQTVRPTSA
jgi:hypothetical protein